MTAPHELESVFRHEAALYGSDDELVGIAVPFLSEGLERGEPCLVSLPQRAAGLVRDELSDSDLRFVPPAATHGSPTTVIRVFQEALGELVGGARMVRMIGEVPHPGTGAPWDWWARFEATINRAFAEFSAWGLCSYDTRLTPQRVLDDVMATHPLVSTAGQRWENGRYEAPEEFLARWRPIETEAFANRPPVAELTDPTPDQARRSVWAKVAGSLGERTGDFVYAVSEAVTNALCHGHAPARLRLWVEEDRVVAAISDRGYGPSDPFAGLVPGRMARHSAGLGLWMIYQLCANVTYSRDRDGYTLWLTADRATRGYGL